MPEAATAGDEVKMSEILRNFNRQLIYFYRTMSGIYATGLEEIKATSGEYHIELLEALIGKTIAKKKQDWEYPLYGAPSMNLTGEEKMVDGVIYGENGNLQTVFFCLLAQELMDAIGGTWRYHMVGEPRTISSATRVEPGKPNRVVNYKPFLASDVIVYRTDCFDGEKEAERYFLAAQDKRKIIQQNRMGAAKRRAEDAKRQGAAGQ